jgi:hypothetical protein
VIQKPEEGFKGGAHGDHFEETSPFLKRAEEFGRKGFMISPLSGQEKISHFGFPGRVVIVPGDVGLQTLKIFMDEGRFQLPYRSVDDQPFMDFHIQPVCRLFNEALELGSSFSKKKDGGMGKASEAKSARQEVKAFGDQVGIGLVESVECFLDFFP